MRNLLLAATFAFCSGLAIAGEPVDDCTTVLGSLSVELHHARGLPPGGKTKYACAKRYVSLVGASRQRVLRSLGPPDRSGEDGSWTYLFASRHGETPVGTPELIFRFGGGDAVESVDCHRTKG
jgi:hypothetical protein